MIFKNQKVEPGDIVTFTTNREDYGSSWEREIKGAVVEIDDGRLITLGIHDVDWNGYAENEIWDFRVLRLAEEAIPQESIKRFGCRTPFFKGENVVKKAGCCSVEERGTVIAAYDGHIVVRHTKSSWTSTAGNNLEKIK